MKRPLPLAEATALARAMATQLAPVVERVEVVGSVRRQKETVSDIELLIEPRTAIVEIGLFETTHGPDIEAVQRIAQSWGSLASIGARYIKVLAAGGYQVDLFLCHPPAQWGSLLAIRTGPAPLSQHAVTLLARRGYPHRDGGIVHRGQRVPVPDEETFFRLAGLPCLPPQHRHRPDAYIEVPRTYSARNGGVPV